MRIPIILAVAALALAGCNANQSVNPSSQGASQVWAGRYSDTNPYDPDQLRAEPNRARRRRPLRAGWHAHIFSRNSPLGEICMCHRIPVFPPPYSLP